MPNSHTNGEVPLAADSNAGLQSGLLIDPRSEDISVVGGDQCVSDQDHRRRREKGRRTCFCGRLLCRRRRCLAVAGCGFPGEDNLAEAMGCVEGGRGRVARRPLAVLHVDVATVPIEVPIPAVARLWRCVFHVFCKILEGDRYFAGPGAVGIGILVQRTRVRPGDADSRGVPFDAGLLRPVGPMPVDVGPQHVPLDIEIEVGPLGVGGDHHFETVVLGDGIVVFRISGGDVLVFTDVADVEVLIVPEHFDDRAFLLSLLPPRKMQRPHV